MKPVKKDLWLECRCGHIFIPRIMTFLFLEMRLRDWLYTRGKITPMLLQRIHNFFKLKVVHLKSRKYMTSGYMVFYYQNCSDLLWEKIGLVIEKNFWNSRLKADNLQNIWDHYNPRRTIYSNNERLVQFLKRMLF